VRLVIKGCFYCFSRIAANMPWKSTAIIEMYNKEQISILLQYLLDHIPSAHMSSNYFRSSYSGNLQPYLLLDHTKKQIRNVLQCLLSHPYTHTHTALSYSRVYHHSSVTQRKSTSRTSKLRLQSAYKLELLHFYFHFLSEYFTFLCLYIEPG
jgi:hypothetical protein